MTAYRPGLPAAEVDAALRSALAVLDRARECALLWFGEIVRRNLFRDLGFASAHQYASEALGFSRNRTNQFLRLAREFERLPRLREAVAAGRVGWTKAQQVTRVATPASEAAWVAAAETSSRRELGEQIRRRRRGGRPAQGQAQLPLAAASEAPVTAVLSFRLESLDLARYEALVEVIKKRGLVRPEATREEVLLAALAEGRRGVGGAPAHRWNALPGRGLRM